MMVPSSDDVLRFHVRLFCCFLLDLAHRSANRSVHSWIINIAQHFVDVDVDYVTTTPVVLCTPTTLRRNAHHPSGATSSSSTAPCSPSRSASSTPTDQRRQTTDRMPCHSAAVETAAIVSIFVSDAVPTSATFGRLGYGYEHGDGHSHYDEPSPSAPSLALDPATLTRTCHDCRTENAGLVPRNDGALAGVRVINSSVLLLFLVLAIVVASPWHCSGKSAKRKPLLDAGRPSDSKGDVAAGSATTGAGSGRLYREHHHHHQIISNTTDSDCGYTGTFGAIGCESTRALSSPSLMSSTSVPGAWLYEEHLERNTRGESVLGAKHWLLLFSSLTWTGWTWTRNESSDPSTCGSDHIVAVVVSRTCEDGGSFPCQELAGGEAGISTSELGQSVLFPKDQVSTRAKTLGVTCRDNIGSTMALTASDRISSSEHLSLYCSVDDSPSSDGTKDEATLGVGTRHAEASRPADKEAHRSLIELRDAPLDARRPRSLRRAASTGYLLTERGVLGNDDDDQESIITGGDDDDFYWTEQVSARLSLSLAADGERDSRHTACRNEWPDVSFWPRERREVEADNWRVRSSHAQVTEAQAVTTPGMTCDGTENDKAIGARLRRYSSPPLNVNMKLSQTEIHGVGSRYVRARCSDPRRPPRLTTNERLISDLPRGIYVVPQKRAGGRCGSPPPVISSATLRSTTDNRPSGHENGFFPLGRRTARALLTPTAAAIATGEEGQAWGPGCLYVDDPPDDEGGLAEVWWERLKLTSPVGTSGCVKHASDGSSWRDRYENDPASRRFMSVHRRAMTHG